MSSAKEEYYSDDELIDDKSNSDVLLGFVDAPIEIGEDEPTIEDTFIGGKPIWLHPGSPPDQKLITCDNCHKEMALLLQAFSPLDDKLYDRVIYVFGCKNTALCSKKKGSIKCIRAISKDPERVASIKQELEDVTKADLDEKLQQENKKKLNAELTKDLFSAAKEANNSSSNPFDSNPFGSSSGANPFASSSTTSANPFAKQEPEAKKPETFASVVAKNAPKTTKKKSKQTKALELPEYPGFFIYVEKEKFKKVTMEPELEKYKDLIEKMDDESTHEEEDIGSSAPQLNSQTTKMANMLDDKYFEAFTNTVKHNPGQVLRYDLGGKPLLYSGQDEIAPKFAHRNAHEVAVPAPAYNPSSRRRFELQLMPKAIMDLENLQDKDVTLADILNGMSWGTIIVCTDEEDYIPDEQFDANHVGYISEWVGVQWEESV